MFGELLRLEFSVGMEIVGFADDITLEVYVESIEEVEVITAYSIKDVEAWRDPGKWNWFTNRKSEQQAVISVGDCTITSKRSNAWGVKIDDKLTFGSHVDYACTRASTAIVALSRMMSTSSTVYASKCKLLASVTPSILKYDGQTGGVALST